MAISAKELSLQVTDGVRVSDKVRFDFIMSQTSSVTLRVPPPSRGRLTGFHRFCLFRTKINSFLSVPMVRIIANIMAISAKELSVEATYGVRVCDEARFDFKRSQTPSVTAAPCHLPLHKGGLPDSIAIASFGLKSIVFCSFQQCQYVLKQDGFIRDGG